MSRSTVSKYGASADFISKWRAAAPIICDSGSCTRAAPWKRRTRRSVKPSAASAALRPLDAPQRRGVDLRPGRNARREACVCGLVPREEPRLGGEAAYLGLREAAFSQRRAHAHFAQRFHAGAVALIVGGVRAVYYQAESVALRLARYRAENPFLA